jgi:tetratricopeptide (TPR) repeat protein
MQTSGDDSDPLVVFNQAQDAHEKGALENALKLYARAIELYPEFPEAEYQRATIFISLGRFDEAEKSLRRALDLRSDWSLAVAQLGALRVRQNRFDDAEKILNAAIEIDARNFPAYVALTELRLKTKASSAVLNDLLEKLQKLSSNTNPNPSILAATGAVQRTLGDFAAAKINLTRALSLERTNGFALAERIEILLAEGDAKRAIEDSKALLTRNPASLQAKLLLARSYADDGNNSEALKVLSSADNDNADVVELKNSLTALATTDVPNLEKQLETNPQNSTILSRLCTLTRTSNPTKSLDYCRRAAFAEPGNLAHAIGYGAALVQARQFDSAVNLFRKVLVIAPDNYTAHANLATALFELKRYGEAKIEYKILIEKKPDLAIGYYFLAITDDNLGEYVEALASYQEFLRRADAKTNQLEIDKVNLRLPALQRQINKGGKKQ